MLTGGPLRGRSHKYSSGANGMKFVSPKSDFCRVTHAAASSGRASRMLMSLMRPNELNRQLVRIHEAVKLDF